MTSWNEKKFVDHPRVRDLNPLQRQYGVLLIRGVKPDDLVDLSEADKEQVKALIKRVLR